MAISRANVAAQVMEHLCTCPEHGYSQPGRHGTSGFCTVQTDAGPVKVKKGDRDCSSAVCEAWDGILHYNGKADGGASGGAGGAGAAGGSGSAGGAAGLPVPRGGDARRL